MKFANVRELKRKTSQMLRTVEGGTTVLVTTHGRPTAMLVPVTEDDIEDVLLTYSPTLRKKVEEGLKVVIQDYNHRDEIPQDGYHDHQLDHGEPSGALQAGFFRHRHDRRCTASLICSC